MVVESQSPASAIPLLPQYLRIMYSAFERVSLNIRTERARTVNDSGDEAQDGEQDVYAQVCAAVSL